MERVLNAIWNEIKQFGIEPIDNNEIKYIKKSVNYNEINIKNKNKIDKYISFDPNSLSIKTSKHAFGFFTNRYNLPNIEYCKIPLNLHMDTIIDIVLNVFDNEQSKKIIEFEYANSNANSDANSDGYIIIDYNICGISIDWIYMKDDITNEYGRKQELILEYENKFEFEYKTNFKLQIENKLKQFGNLTIIYSV